MAIGEKTALCSLPRQSGDNLRVRMTQQQGGAAHRVVDIFLTVDFPLSRPFGTLDVFREGSLEPAFMGNTTCQAFARVAEQLFGRL